MDEGVFGCPWEVLVGVCAAFLCTFILMPPFSVWLMFKSNKDVDLVASSSYVNLILPVVSMVFR